MLKLLQIQNLHILDLDPQNGHFKVFWGKNSQNTWCFFLKFVKKLKINYFYPNQEVWGYSGCLNYEKLRLFIFLTNFRQFGLPRHPFLGQKSLILHTNQLLQFKTFTFNCHNCHMPSYNWIIEKCSGGDKSVPEATKLCRLPERKPIEGSF